MDYDVVIAGAGLAGRIAAIGFAHAGYKTLCLDPNGKDASAIGAKGDLRSTALLQPSQALLDRMGLWDHLKPLATQLKSMRIIDAGGPETKARVTRDFDAADISDKPFGWNIPNWRLWAALEDALEQYETVTYRHEIACTDVATTAYQARVHLSDGTKVTARMVIGADGRNSKIRDAVGIKARTWRFGQKALAFAVNHPIPHENVSTEVHRSGGPFTLVPLPDHEGMPSSAVVWMEEGSKALDLMTLPIAEFEARMSERSCHVLGPLHLATQRSIWPIISQLSDRLVAERVALIAEAAHVVPPIGAQGLNTSLGDLSVLLDILSNAKYELGSEAMLQAYERRRLPEIRARVLGVGALNMASQAQLQPLKDARAALLGVLHDVPFIRRGLMQLGLGHR